MSTLVVISSEEFFEYMFVLLSLGLPGQIRLEACTAADVVLHGGVMPRWRECSGKLAQASRRAVTARVAHARERNTAAAAAGLLPGDNTEILIRHWSTMSRHELYGKRDIAAPQQVHKTHERKRPRPRDRKAASMHVILGKASTYVVVVCPQACSADQQLTPIDIERCNGWTKCKTREACDGDKHWSFKLLEQRMRGVLERSRVRVISECISSSNGACAGIIRSVSSTWMRTPSTLEPL